MERDNDCALDRYITALPPNLWLMARAAFDELSNNPFLPIFSKDEIARLICSPGFQSYLEDESKLKGHSLFFLYSAHFSTQH